MSETAPDKPTKKPTKAEKAAAKLAGAGAAPKEAGQGPGQQQPVADAAPAAAPVTQASEPNHEPSKPTDPTPGELQKVINSQARRLVHIEAALERLAAHGPWGQELLEILRG